LLQKGLAQRHFIPAAAVKVDLQGRAAADGAQLAAEQRQIASGTQLFAQLAFHLIRMLQHAVQRAVLGDELERRLFPDTWNAGNIVAGIAHEALHVRYLRRGEAIGIIYALRIQQQAFGDALACEDDFRFPAHQLQAVTVAREHIGVNAPLVGQARGGSQQIVRFVALQLADAHMHGLQHLSHQRQLGPQFLRHGLAGGLVAVVEGVAEGGSVHVHHHAQPIRAVFAQRLDQHAEKAMHGIGIGSVRSGKQRKGVKAPKNQTIPIHQQYRLLVRVAHETSIGAARSARPGLLYPLLYHRWELANKACGSSLGVANVKLVPGAKRS